VREFIGEWELRLARAVHAGCHYSDAVLAFKLLERANLEKTELELGKNQWIVDLEKVDFMKVLLIMFISSVADPDPIRIDFGFGSMRSKRTHKNRKK
jgi:hypothetical protein